MSENRFLDLAFSRHLEALGDIASCVTRERVFGRTYSTHPVAAREFGFAERGVVRSRHGGRSQYRMDFLQLAQWVRNDLHPNPLTSLEIVAYEYRLLDHLERELLVYHYQPGGLGPSFPHLHVSAFLDVQVNALARQHVDLDKRHLITGRVGFADFVRMLFTEFDVRPLRPDWEKRFAATPQ